MSAQKPFDLHRASYDVLNGTNALRALAYDLLEKSSDDPIGAITRDTLIFTLEAMADKTEACAQAWIDQAEISAKATASA